jgi:hypothetical protein
MKNRELTVAICGAIVGIILGSVSSSLAVPMQGDMLVRAGQYIPFHNAPDAEDYTRRKVDEMNLEIFDNKGAIPNYPTLKPAATSSSSTSSVDMSPCGMVKRALAKVRATCNAVVPVNNFRNAEIRTKMEAAFKDAMSECPDAAMVKTSSSSSVTEGPMVDNNCEKYSVRSVRYSQCVIFEKEGKVFP